MFSTDSKTHVVTYGSLVFPEVMEALLGFRPQYENVLLRGFRRSALRGRVYPGLRRDLASEVVGRLYFDLDSSAMEILENFEDDLYERATISVDCSRGRTEALLYLVPQQAYDELADSSWSPETFERHFLNDYLKMCRDFRAKQVSVLMQL